MVDARKVTFAEVVALAIKIGSSLEFTLEEQARAFGFEGRPSDDPYIFARQMLNPPVSAKMTERIYMVCDIKSKLMDIFEDRHGEHPERESRWIRVKLKELEGKSVKDLIVSGSRLHLTLALNTVSEIKIVD